MVWFKKKKSLSLLQIHSKLFRGERPRSLGFAAEWTGQGEGSSSGMGMVHPCEVIVLCSVCRCVLGSLLGIASRMSLHDFI